MNPFLKAFLKLINLVGLVDLILDGIVEPALKKAVEKTETKIDDSALALIYPVVEEEAKKLAYAKINELFA